MGKLKSIFLLMRPQQWFKSASLLFSAAIVFYRVGFSANLVANLILALLAVSFLSSSIYVFNDVSDVEKDRMHPIKRKRPVASGEVSIKEAMLLGIFLIIISLAMLFAIKPVLVFTGLFMLLLSSLYSFKPTRLKDIPILDIIVPAINFTLRVIIGWYALASTAIPSAVMFFPFFIAAFLLSAKRMAEFNYLGPEAPKVRKVYKFYNKDNLLFMINFNMILSVLFYMLFSLIFDPFLIFLSPWFFFQLYWYKGFLAEKNSVVKKPEDVFFEKKKFTLSLALFCASWLVLLILRK